MRKSNPTSPARPSPALVVAVVALVAALAGSAVALPGKNTVDKNDIQKGAVTKKAFKKSAVNSKAIKDGGVGAVDIAAGVIPDTTIPDGSISGAKLADGAVNSAKIADGQVGAVDLTDAEAPRIVGATGQPAFSNGGEGDCVWQSGSALLAGLAPVSFSKDPQGYVHLTGLAVASDGAGGDAVCDSSDPGESEDGIIYTLPAGYAPDNSELQGPDSGLVIIVGDEGLTEGPTTIPGGAIFYGGTSTPVMDGALFRPAGPAVKSDRSAPADLDAILDLVR